MESFVGASRARRNKESGVDFSLIYYIKEISLLPVVDEWKGVCR